jgi:ferredoxin
MFLTRKYTVIVKNRDLSFEVKSGKILFTALKEHGINLNTLCGGSGQCGKCKVKIEGKDITKPTRLEKRSLSDMSINSGIRLACEYAIKSHVTVDLDEFARRVNEDPNIISVNTYTHDEVYGEDDLPPFVPPVIEESTSSAATSNYVEEEVVTQQSQEELHHVENIVEKVEEITQPFFHKPEIKPIYDEIKTQQYIQEPVEEIEELPENEILAEPEVIEEPEPVIIKYENEIETKETEDKADLDYSTDGLLLIQTPGGITYSHYAAGIASITSRDFIETDKTLADLIRAGELKGFINLHLKNDSYERAIIILSEKSFEGENIFGLVNYCSFRQEGLFCEVIQPANTPRDILKFFRFLNQNSGRKMIIPLDSLEKIYFFNSGSIMGIDAGLRSDYLFSNFKINGSNPVTKMNDDLMSYEKKNNDLPPDSLSLSAFFKTAALLYSKGLLNRQFQLADKMSLVGDGLDGGHPLRLIAKFSKHSFKIDAGHDILIPQTAFDDLFRLRTFLHAAIKYAEKRCGKPDTIIFYTLFPIRELAESMITLEMLPKRYHEVIRTFSEDPTLFAINFFHKSSVTSYSESHLKQGEDVSLEDDEIFLGIYEKINEEFSDLVK